MKKIVVLIAMMAGLTMAQEIIPLPEPVQVPGTMTIQVPVTNTVTKLRLNQTQYDEATGNWRVSGVALTASNKMVRPVFVVVTGVDIGTYCQTTNVQGITVAKLREAVSTIAFQKSVASLTNAPSMRMSTPAPRTIKK